MAENSQILSTTNTSIEIIELIEDSGGATPEYISDRLNIAESTVYKHLCTLKKHGLVVRENNKYVLGVKFYSIGMSARNRKSLFKIAGEYTVKLAELSREEAQFGVEENGRMIVLYDFLHSSKDSSLETKHYQHLHTTAMGKAILSKFDEEKVEQIINQWGTPSITEKSIVNKEELHKELNKVRKQGYAISDQEAQTGKRVVGVAVEYQQNVIGAFCIAGPAYRIQDADLHEKYPRLIKDTIADFESEIEGSL